MVCGLQLIVLKTIFGFSVHSMNACLCIMIASANILFVCVYVYNIFMSAKISDCEFVCCVINVTVIFIRLSYILSG